MKTKRTSAVGIMSGTSLDGLDLCYVEFTFDDGWQFKIIASECVSYNSTWYSNLSNAHNLSTHRLDLLSEAFGIYIGEQVNMFLNKFQLAKPDLVCSHGHTVFHDPTRKFTLQIGDGSTIAQLCGVTTVSDFRSLDVSLGGQGAPLVPIGDQLLFSNFEGCLNLGGFSNISFTELGERKAFDVCPVNIVLNPLANSLGKPFDDCGVLARSGRMNILLLEKCNNLSIYSEEQRPSLSREWLEGSFLPIIQASEASIEDKLRTIVEHVATQISRVINNTSRGGRVLVTGGGAKNTFLIERISELSEAEIVVPDNQIVDYKEALIFALLGVLRTRNEVNVLSSVTGAERDSSSGKIDFPA